MYFCTDFKDTVICSKMQRKTLVRILSVLLFITSFSAVAQDEHTAEAKEILPEGKTKKGRDKRIYKPSLDGFARF